MCNNVSSEWEGTWCSEYTSLRHTIWSVLAKWYWVWRWVTSIYWRGSSYQCLSKDIELERLLSKVDARSTLLFGDLNEASHFDVSLWTPEATPVKVKWSSTLLLESRGFYDVFRVKYPNSVTDLGNTHPTPEWKNAYKLGCRIDYIFSPSKRVEDVVLFHQERWGSDHYGVWADITFD